MPRTVRSMRLALLATVLLSSTGRLTLAQEGAEEGASLNDNVGALGKNETSVQQKRLEENHGALTRWLEGLPTMPPSHSPESEQWTNRIAVCSIMRDENITDVAEWIRYYQWLGVDHVFLTDNDSHNSDDVIATLSRAFPSSFLTVRKETTPRAQLKAYAWCAEEHRLSYNWMAFFDVDEYLVLRGEVAADVSAGNEPKLKTFLDRYKLEPGLSVNWIKVGPGGLARRPREGGVLKFYKHCVPVPDMHVKTIANTWFLEGVALHPHNFIFRNHVGSVNEKFIELEEFWKPLPKAVQQNQWKIEECNSAYESSSPQLQMHCYKEAEPLFRNGTVDHVALFHFATKSEQDFKLKMARGSGMSQSAKGYSYFNEIFECEPS